MADIDHVVVLMLENRSFDHMLGFLAHPDPAFDGLLPGPFTNPGLPGRPPVEATPTAGARAPANPDHTHEGVMRQLCAVRHRGGWRTTNQGFVESYEQAGRNRHAAGYEGLLGPLVSWWKSRKKPPGGVAGLGPGVMACQPAANVPVLSELALEFAVCTRWFSSVPGETWPNRNFLHAATSDGETNITRRPYTDRTIFELLEENGRDWHIYHDDTPQAWAFPRLWDEPGRHARWFGLADFGKHVAAGSLPEYSFLEPNHAPPVHTIDRSAALGTPGRSNSQHPANNLLADAAGEPEGDSDFHRGEELIATVYETLRANPELFERTLLVITYDEHGGFYDHVPPPDGVPAPADPPSRLGRVLKSIIRKKVTSFDFTLLGVRVPTVLISPYIRPSTVDTVVRDHASVPATLRALFAPNAKPLTRRDAWAEPFHRIADLDQPRRRADLPDLSAYATGFPAVPHPATLAAAGDRIPEHFEPYFQQAAGVADHLRRVGEPEAKGLLPAGGLREAADITRLFQDAAQRHRTGAN